MPKEKKGILSVILNGDNPVKVSKKQAGKLRGFFKKIIDGLTTVPYIPGTIFEAAVERKKAKKEAKEKDEEYVPFAERIEKKIKEAVETHKNENKETKKEDTVNDVNTDTNEEENVINENKETEVADGEKEDDKNNLNAESENSQEKDDKKVNVLTGQTLDDIMAKYNAEHESVKPVEIDIPEKEETKAEVTNDEENNAYENIGEDYEPDTTYLDELIEKHSDLTKFASWDDYYNSLSEKKLKEMTRKGTLLQENVFTDIRMRQAEEYIRIDEEKEGSRQVKRARLVSEEEDRQTRKEANREEKKELNRRIAEIDKEQEKLANESKANKKEVNTLDRETEKNQAEIEAMKKITSKEVKIDDVKSSAQAEEDEIVERIMKNVYGEDLKKQDETVASKDEEKEPIQTENSVEKVESESTELTGENNETEINQDGTITVSPVEPEEVDDSKSIFGLPASDAQDDLVSEISDPNAFNNESEEAAPAGLDYMGFDPQTRSELGQEAFDRWKNSDGTQSFDEIKNSLADEYNAAGKGKTK